MWKRFERFYGRVIETLKSLWNELWQLETWNQNDWCTKSLIYRNKKQGDVQDLHDNVIVTPTKMKPSVNQTS
jgi:hypothetical protein